ncbi:MAG: hypothetical protein HOE44_06970, partial [Candidatus Marinimicrobia bacterium]|nr:hypothetical protein [Candidatus Neomarinimicrobiota bacterium]
MIRVSTLIIIAFLISSCERTAEQFELKSPDGTIAVQLEMKDNSPHYSIRIDGEEVIKSSALGFDLISIPKLSAPLTILQQSTSENKSTWSQVLGEDKEITDNHYFARFQ